MDFTKVVGKMMSKKWYHIKARDMGIYKPNGKVITFWLWGDSEDHIRDLLSKKNCKDIQYIKGVGEDLEPFL